MTKSADQRRAGDRSLTLNITTEKEKAGAGGERCHSQPHGLLRIPRLMIDLMQPTNNPEWPLRIQAGLLGKYMMAHYAPGTGPCSMTISSRDMGVVGAQYMSYDRYDKDQQEGRAFGMTISLPAPLSRPAIWAVLPMRDLICSGPAGRFHAAREARVTRLLGLRRGNAEY